MNRINPSFVFNQIRKYNKSRRQTLKDAALTAVGIHVGLLEKKSVIIRDLTQEERDHVLYYLQQFLQSQGLKVTIR
jgi:hypothetical protein